VFLCLLIAASVADAQDRPRVVEDLTRGLRFSPPFLSLAESPSDPDTLYAGVRWGRIYVSRDGGKSWNENYARTSPGAFYGSIRAQADPGRVISTGVSFARDPNSLLQGQDVGDSILQAAGASARRAAINGTVLYGLSRSVDGPGGAGGGAGARLGVGLRETAPWLAIAVRKKRRWGVGIRLQQTLALKAAPATSIGFFDVDPRDPEVALAATNDGLLKSNDGGFSWPTVMTGALRSQRTIHHVLRHPSDPDVVYAATGLGLRISRDAGETWAPLVHGLVAINDTRWVAIDPNDHKVMYVGLSWALVKSEDGGENFRIIFDHPWPRAALVRRVLVDPHDSKRVFMATADGLFVSDNAGYKWDRTGGLVMTGFDTIVLSAGPEPGHFLTGNARDLWETWDGGKTWRIAYFAPIEWDVRWAFFSRHEPGAIWVLTSAEILKLAPRAPESLGPEVVRRFRELVRREPPLHHVVQSALRRSGVDRPTVNAFRRRAQISAFLPQVTAALWARTVELEDDSARRSGMFGAATTIPLTNAFRDSGLFYTVFAKWNLPGIWHSQDEAPTDRVGSLNRGAEWRIRMTVINLYQERRRLQLEGLANEDEGRPRLLRDLRIEELTAHLNALAGDLLPFRPAL